jgi:hypothetical protein
MSNGSDEQWRENMQNAWAALHMIRQTVETLAPGTLPSEEAVLEVHGPQPIHEAQAIVDALRAILATPRAPARMLKFTEDADYPNEWHACSGGLYVARIVFDEAEEELPWSWYMQEARADADVMDPHGFTESLHEAKEAVAATFKKWLAWAEL